MVMGVFSSGPLAGIIARDFLRLLHASNDGRLPLPIEHRLVSPIGADVEGEGSLGCPQPVAFLVLAGRFGARMER